MFYREDNDDTNMCISPTPLEVVQILMWQTMNDRAYPTVKHCLGLFNLIWLIFRMENPRSGEYIGHVCSVVFGVLHITPRMGGSTPTLEWE